MTTTPFLSDAAATAPQSLIDAARQRTAPRVAIASAGAALPMMAAQEATALGLMEPVFVGERGAILAESEKLRWDIGSYDLVEASGEAESGLVAATMCGGGEADILMKGNLHTDVFMKTALNRDAGLRTGARLVHIFAMTAPGDERPLLISDAALNVAPDIETRKTAIEHCVAVLLKLGIERPRIALLSATESVIDSVPSSVEAKELADWAITAIDSADVSGPLAMDLIFSPEAAATKGRTSDPVAGNANAIIVPDIVSGNALFKTLVYTRGACAAGMVMGAKVPILLTSRADPPAARVASIALASRMIG